MSHIRLGKIAGLEISADRSAWFCAVGMWVALAGLGLAAFHLPVLAAILGGLAATLLHYASELFHQFGHAIAARSAGYPMTGVRYWAVFGASRYPPDEPELSPATHIRRALGGAPVSAVVTLIGGVIAWLLTPSGGAIWLVALFFALDNLLVFTLGAFLPLGFTDGSTILKYWRKR